ncbi:Cloroperoxidase [Mycena kentingensis (nom. inval.)]|nr:Cloroperoxidase [Mycena kentingensis (nom. inval.)]
MRCLLVLPVFFAARAVAQLTPDIQDGQTGVVMSLPPQPTETGLKQIPDAAHPFIAPGPNDQRGPCPGVNTLANHGYIPRNGIASFEELINGITEAFNIPVNMAAGMAALNFVRILRLERAIHLQLSSQLTRGNMFVNKISIGGVSPLVPPLPGKIDGPVTQGIAKHGRNEGDASMTRADAFIGDNRNFQNILYDMALLQLGKFGDDGPDGNSTVFNVNTMIGIKKQNIASDQAANPQFTLNVARHNLVFADSALILNVFANGTTKLSTLPIIGSFFRNQTFPQNWFRSATPINGADLNTITNQVRAAVPIPPGRNNAQGVYVPDPPVPAPWNSSVACSVYWDQNGHMPSTLVTNSTGVLRQNVNFLLDLMFNAVSANPGCTERVLPFGQPGI